MCATRLRDVSNYFRGSHVTFNARNDDEVNMEDIKEQVAKASASTYNFKVRSMDAVPRAHFVSSRHFFSLALKSMQEGGGT